MFRMGIIGCGTMAARMIASIKELDDIEIVAVASRDKARATKFCKANCPDAKPLGSYEQMTRQKDIDMVFRSEQVRFMEPDDTLVARASIPSAMNPDFE